MAIDQARLTRFLDELRDYLDAVNPQTSRRAVRGRLLDLLARGQIDLGATGELEAAVRDLLGPEYAALAADVEAQYSDLVEMQNRIYDDLGIDVRRDSLRVRAVEEAVRAEIGMYGDDATREVARRVRRAIDEGDDVRALERRLGGISDRVDAHRRTLARSQIVRYSRVLKMEQAMQAGVQFFEYAGVATPTTRPFCLGHLGRTVHHDNILRMRNGNREPVESNCGGWSCQHVWEPDPFATGQSGPGGADVPMRFVEFGEGRANVRGYTDEAGEALLRMKR